MRSLKPLLAFILFFSFFNETFAHQEENYFFTNVKNSTFHKLANKISEYSYSSRKNKTGLMKLFSECEKNKNCIVSSRGILEGFNLLYDTIELNDLDLFKKAYFIAKSEKENSILDLPNLSEYSSFILGENLAQKAIKSHNLDALEFILEQNKIRTMPTKLKNLLIDSVKYTSINSLIKKHYGEFDSKKYDQDDDIFLDQLDGMIAFINAFPTADESRVDSNN